MLMGQDKCRVPVILGIRDPTCRDIRQLSWLSDAGEFETGCGGNLTEESGPISLGFVHRDFGR